MTKCLLTILVLLATAFGFASQAEARDHHDRYRGHDRYVEYRQPYRPVIVRPAPRVVYYEPAYRYVPAYEEPVYYRPVYREPYYGGSSIGFSFNFR